MFGKKCSRCRNKIKKNFGFCPYCGLHFEKDENEERDYGLLGKRDLDEGFPDFNIKMPFGFNTLFSSLLREVDKQFKELDKEIGREDDEERRKPRNPFIRKSGISISISSSGDMPPIIKVNRFGDNAGNIMEIEDEEEGRKARKLPTISEEKARKLALLPRKEADTKIRRLSNKIVYEIELPGVDSIKDVVINKLENSLEVKAFAKDKVFVKLIPIKMPLLNYKLNEGKLVMEFRE